MPSTTQQKKEANHLLIEINWAKACEMAYISPDACRKYLHHNWDFNLKDSKASSCFMIFYWMQDPLGIGKLQSRKINNLILWNSKG